MRYAIVIDKNRQHRVEEGSVIDLDLREAEAGSQLELQVMLLADGEAVQIGGPVLDGSVVKATVLDQVKGPKIRVFKYKPKKRYRVATGHRQGYTRVRIDEIVS
jgi:large subunit ribosomal protein L21